jgi:hypothetical protein
VGKKGKIENLKPFEPGQSGNPAGPAPGYVQARTILKRLLAVEVVHVNPISGLLQTMAMSDVLLLEQIKKAKEGDTRAFEAVFDRVDGKPVQTLASDADNPLPGAVNIVVQALNVEPITSEAQLQKLLDEQTEGGNFEEK